MYVFFRTLYMYVANSILCKCFCDDANVSFYDVTLFFVAASVALDATYMCAVIFSL
jgi:hypothetical protein